MNQPALLWPWPWWTSFVATALVVIVSAAAAELMIRRRNQRMRKLGEAVREAGLTDIGAGFSVGDDKNALVVSGARIAVVDVGDARVVQVLDLKDTIGL